MPTSRTNRSDPSGDAVVHVPGGRALRARLVVPSAQRRGSKRRVESIGEPSHFVVERVVLRAARAAGQVSCVRTAGNGLKKGKEFTIGDVPGRAAPRPDL